MPKRLERCVKDVEKTGKKKSNAFAICVNSTGLKPHKRSKESRKKASRK
jgi:hypothetical protein